MNFGLEMDGLLDDGGRAVTKNLYHPVLWARWGD